MRLIETLRSVILSVRTNKFRVFLTSLGIIIGTFTIIMVVGIGKASEKAVSDQYKRLSVESIMIQPARRQRMGSGSTKALTKDEALQMAELLQNVKSVGVSVTTSSDIAYNNVSEQGMVMGINEDYADITNLSLMYGDFFTDEDGLLRKRYVVLGYNLADYLFEGDIESAVGEKVIIKGATFDVIGVLNRIGGSGGMGGSAPGGMSASSDDMAFIPYEVAIKYTAGRSNTRGGFSGGSVANYIALANDIDSVDLAIEEIEQYIYDITGSEESYTVVDAGSTLASAQETAKTMSSLLIAVAAIVLLVSGIGIMNVLMVAVKERTREIGILKSIGASRRDILLEFLIEAVFISITGGIFGVILSAFAPYVLSYTEIDFLPSINGIMLGLLFSVATGIFFGYYPAVKASKLKPIEALNYE